MQNVSRSFATPATAALFLISAGSGVLLLFDFKPRLFHWMHVWLSLALLVPVAFHVQSNWRSAIVYVPRGNVVIFGILSVAAALALGMTFAKGRVRPQSPASQLLASAPLTSMAPLLRTTPDSLGARLLAGGYVVRSADETLGQVAAGSYVSLDPLSGTLYPGRVVSN